MGTYWWVVTRLWRTCTRKLHTLLACCWRGSLITTETRNETIIIERHDETTWPCTLRRPFQFFL
jgi:hypothetical protein